MDRYGLRPEENIEESIELDEANHGGTLDSSKRRAFEFYKKSAEQGIASYYKLGHFYKYGNEFEINLENEIVAMGQC
ncbi:hypothetical protein RCL_jg23898.t1 [Rhizophagus clarus]|uniref:Uncharacterized protein n=1 Tax=Rhizophagus clarus TaxID=94130 RepID=A0A8H3LQ10_9GLOM|nr:hypothetical protein RCL_jg23898.t1 [Rhizophagus clarus]